MTSKENLITLDNPMTSLIEDHSGTMNPILNKKSFKKFKKGAKAAFKKMSKVCEGTIVIR